MQYINVPLLFLSQPLFSVELHITETEKDDLTINHDLRERLQTGSRKRKLEMADNQATLETVTQEMKVLRGEIHKLRQEAVRAGLTNTEESALGFSKPEFLALSPTKSLQWVTSTLAPKLKEESNKYPSYFGAIKLMAMPSEMVVWTCAGFNRGMQCHSKWHVYERIREHGVRDIRLHCCTLCYDGLGVLSEHRLIECPWLKESTWIEIRGGKKSPDSPTRLGSTTSQPSTSSMI